MQEPAGTVGNGDWLVASSFQESVERPARSRTGLYHRAMALDHYVTLGRSGLRVSPLCLGAMTFGEDWGWGSSVVDSKKILDRYIEAGGNFIDTANGYTKG